ncbi:hypothetical protein T459_08736 [Capsicum annuum]|uniref:Helicase SMUBP-2/HCS1 1B domain-containing protein n=1 Tax=Capsicum annuum TaxID=4072 RepID=A0A2G2ZXB2_CAPAN|nr:hypothetical protein T459_08736 [Capsicum annuum]
MEKGKSTSKNKKKNRPASSSAITKEQFVSTMTPLIDLEKGAELSVSMCSAETRSLDSAQKKGSTILNLKCVDVQGLFTSFRFYVQTGLMGKTLLEFQSNKGDILPPHKFGTHDIVVLKPSKAVLGCPALGQGVVYRLKDSSITVAFDDVLEEGLNNPLRLEKLVNEVTYRRMKDTLIQLSKGVLKGPASNLVPVLFGERQPTMSKKDVNFTPLNRNLDHSQSLGTQGYGLVVNEVGENQEFYRPCDRKIRKELLRELAAINGIMAQPWTVGEITMLLVILYAIPIPTHILTFPLKLVYRRHMYQACMDVTNMRIGEGLGDDICKKTDKDCFGRLGDLN